MIQATILLYKSIINQILKYEKDVHSLFFLYSNILLYHSYHLDCLFLNFCCDYIRLLSEYGTAHWMAIME